MPSKIKINRYISQEKKGRGLQGDKYIRNYSVQFVLRVDYPDEALAKIKLLLCTFPLQ